MPTPLSQAIVAALADGPLTAGELAQRLGRSLAVIRNTTSTLYFTDKVIACDAKGRYSLRDDGGSNGVVRIGHGPSGDGRV